MLLSYCPGKTVLDVKADNENAIRLYEKIGYTVVGEVRKIVAGEETFKFLQMSKLIPRVLKSDVAT